MAEDIELLGFAQMINSEIRDRATGSAGNNGRPDFKENVFTEFVLEHMSEAGVVENAEVCHFEARIKRRKARVNGFALNNEADTLNLFTCIFHDAIQPPKVLKKDISRVEKETLCFLDAAMNGHHQRMEKASDAFAMASRIYEVSRNLKNIRIFILTDGLPHVREFKGDKNHNIPIPVEVEIWDIERFFRSMRSGLPRDVIEINFRKLFGEPIPCLPMPCAAEDYMAYLAILPAEIIYRIYEEYGQRFLEFNVRSFLQARGKVNKGIKDTLLNEPDCFMAYNNGISATADSLELILSDDRQAIESVRGLQIVNGGQTTASLHRAKKYYKADISKVFVPAKITVIEAGKLDKIVPKISLYANSQNTIQVADFSANTPFHVEVERLSSIIWCPGEQGRWFYERARGQYQVAKSREATNQSRRRKFQEKTPPSRKFTKTDMAKFINSWEQLPHIVSLGTQKNFVMFMTELQNGKKDWKPDEIWYHKLIAKAILFKQATRIVKQENFPAYKANIVTYLIAYLSFKTSATLNLLYVWEKQRLSDELANLLHGWSHHIYRAIAESARGRNVTEWCKKEECWQAVRSLELELSDPLPPEMGK